MCTVSWRHLDDGGYHLFCNRDEQRTRREAIEPQNELRHGVRFLAPIDGERGGTWLSVNEFGIGLCVLNGACLAGGPMPPVRREARSRGELPLLLADARTSREACQRLCEIDLRLYPAFTLVMAEPGLPVAIAEWDGRDLAILPNGEPCVPLVSSSFDPDGVRAFRRAEFARAADLEAFHRGHAHGVDAYSPCMHRADAQTVSWSELRVSDEAVSLIYSSGPPCRGVPAVERHLARVS